MQAHELVKKFIDGKEVEKPSPKLTIGEMLDRYLAERTPSKGPSKRAHDKRAAAGSASTSAECDG